LEVIEEKEKEEEGGKGRYRTSTYGRAGSAVSIFEISVGDCYATTIHHTPSEEHGRLCHR